MHCTFSSISQAGRRAHLPSGLPTSWLVITVNRLKLGSKEVTSACIPSAFFLIGIALTAWLLAGCALIEQRTGEGFEHAGYVKAGIWPRHNESILNHYGDISEGILEIKETVTYNRWNLIINPQFLAGGSWPVDQRPTGQVFWNHHGQWIYVDLFYGVEYRLNYKKVKGNWYLGYMKERAYELWHDQTGHTCNCTFSNLWYLKYSWE